MRSMHRRLAWGVVGLMTLSAASAHAQETTTYTYDAKGRVVVVNRSGGPSGTQPVTCNGQSMTGICTVYTYDAADNRSNVVITNSPNGASNGDGNGAATVQLAKYVVVPLNGYTLIKIN